MIVEYFVPTEKFDIFVNGVFAASVNKLTLLNLLLSNAKKEIPDNTIDVYDVYFKLKVKYTIAGGKLVMDCEYFEKNNPDKKIDYIYTPDPEYQTAWSISGCYEMEIFKLT